MACPFILLTKRGFCDFYSATSAKCCLSAHVTNCNYSPSELQNFKTPALNALGCLRLRRTSLTNASLYWSKHSLIFRSFCLFPAFLGLHSASQKVLAIQGHFA